MKIMATWFCLTEVQRINFLYDLVMVKFYKSTESFSSI